jgi:hypothetical protein
MLHATQCYVASGDFWTRKLLVSLSLAEPRENAEAVLTSYELFIYVNIHYITNSLKNILK